MKWLTAIVLCMFATGFSLVTASAEDSSLWEIQRELSLKQFVDLTHTFHPGIPHWKGFPPETVKDLYTYEEHGFRAQEFTHVGQWGTHVDPPAHFHKGLLTVDRIPLQQMILPLVVIDVHKKVVDNPDYILSRGDVEDWEARNGRIPSGAFVVMRTDWSKRWPDPHAMSNADEGGTAHYPGWSVEALKLLFEEREVVAIGHETTDTDPGIRTSKDDYRAESYVLGQNHYQIELLTNIDRVPEKGAIVICTFPKPLNGSGFPARVFAIVE